MSYFISSEQIEGFERDSDLLSGLYHTPEALVQKPCQQF
jgi:hypothetical protein